MKIVRTLAEVTNQPCVQCGAPRMLIHEIEAEPGTVTLRCSACEHRVFARHAREGSENR
jgi:hypothetical protein